MESIYEEIKSGDDGCLRRLLESWEVKTRTFYGDLCDQLSSSENFNSFKKLYEQSLAPEAPNGDLNPLEEQLYAVLGLRAALATEVKSLEALRYELEDSASDFQVRISLEHSIATRRELENELRSTRSRVNELEVQNQILNAEMLGLRSKYDADLAEANTRVRMAEKAVIAATRRCGPPTAPAIPAATNQNGSASDIVSGHTTATTSSARPPPRPSDRPTVSSFSSTSQFRSLSDKFNSPSRIKQYNQLTVLDDFDSLDEDSGDEEKGQNKTGSRELMPLRSLPEICSEAVTQLSTEPPQTIAGPALAPEEKQPTSSCTFSDNPVDEDHSALSGGGENQPVPSTDGDNMFINLSRSRSSTPRDTSPTRSGTQEESAPSLDPAASSSPSDCIAMAPTPTCIPDPQEYTRMLKEVNRLREELQRIQGVSAPQEAPKTDDMKPLTPSKDSNGVAAQANGPQNQSCIEDNALLTGFNSPLHNLSVPIPLTENRRLTDWSVSLDQTNQSLCDSTREDALSSLSARDGGTFDEVVTPRSTLSVGQQTEGQFVCHHCSERTNPPSESFMLDADTDNNAASQASTLRMPDIDTSEDIISREETAHLVDAACSTSPSVILVESQVQSSPEEVKNEATIVGLWQRLRHERKLALDAICVCRTLQQRLSHLHLPDVVTTVKAGDQSSLEKKYPLQLATAEELKELDSDAPSEDHMSILSCALQQLSDETERITAIFDHMKQNEGSSSAITNALEVERKQLQEELDRRLAEYSSAHSRSIAELENARDSLMTKLTAAETRSTQLGTELDAMTQRFRATDRFLNEQLHEREQEREEFQARIGHLSAQIAYLKDVVTALKKEPQPSTEDAIKPLSPRPTENGFLTTDNSKMKPNSPMSSPGSRPEPYTTERMRPSVRHSVNGSWQQTSGTHDGEGSDVDDALPFEIIGHPRRCSSPSVAPTPEIRSSTVNLDSQANHQRSSVLSPQHSGNKVDACVGSSPVKYVDTGVSPLSLQASPATSEVGVYCSQDAQLAAVTTVTDMTTCSTLGLVGAETTGNSSERPANQGLTDYAVLTGNSALNLSLEMRHATLMEELRTSLSKVEALLAEHGLQTVQSPKQCNALTNRGTSISPTVVSDVQQLHQAIRMLVEDMNANIKIFIEGMSNLYEEERQRSFALEKDLSITRSELEKKEEQLRNTELFLQFYGSTPRCPAGLEKFSPLPPLTNSVQSTGSQLRQLLTRCLRLQSFRRSLTYQKSYLILLLGSFRYSPQAVTASLGRGLLMGASPSFSAPHNGAATNGHWPFRTQPGVMRFRAAATVVRVIYRMRLIVSRRQRLASRIPLPVLLNYSSQNDTRLSRLLFDSDGHPASSHTISQISPSKCESHPTTDRKVNGVSPLLVRSSALKKKVRLQRLVHSLTFLAPPTSVNSEPMWGHALDDDFTAAIEHNLTTSQLDSVRPLLRQLLTRCLRLQSFRRSLTYQKSYLILLLGSFRYSPQAVTASLGRGLLMGASPSFSAPHNGAATNGHWPFRTQPGVMRFRAAATVVRVIYRMRLIVSRRQRLASRIPLPVLLNYSSQNDTRLSRLLFDSDGHPASSHTISQISPSKCESHPTTDRKVNGVSPLLVRSSALKLPDASQDLLMTSPAMHQSNGAVEQSSVV
ncbi:hypothetical protein SprV_0200710600 [Sparganum proliferum]